MGLGPITALYHARFNRYLQNRQLDDTSQSRVWCFLGDGECDEPETLGALSLAIARAARQPHLRRQLQPAAPRRPGPRQRQDHPGAGGDVPRRRLERDQGDLGLEVGRAARQGQGRRAAQQDEHHRRRRVPALLAWRAARTSASTSSAPTPASARWSPHLSDDELRWLPRGGHDYRKLYAAYKAATENLGSGAPTAILCKTIKGWTLGPEFEGRNATHQIKKMTRQQLRVLRDRLYLQEEIPDDGARAASCRRTTGRPRTRSSTST